MTYPEVCEAPAAGAAFRSILSDPGDDARHRRRHLEDRVLQPGDVGLDDVETLSLICGLDEPRAEALLDAFGSLPEVLGASAAELARVGGRRAAVRLRLVQTLARRQLERPLRDRLVISASSQLQAYLRATLTGVPREQFRVLFLDKKNRLIAVHLAVRRLGTNGERLNPKKADLQAWREIFAQALRDRGVEAEATPRRARGVTRKAERQTVRKMRERADAGRGPAPRVKRSAYQDAARLAVSDAPKPTDWEARSLDRQRRTRALYLAQAKLLSSSQSPLDRELARSLKAFVAAMPAPDSQRLALARELRAANAKLRTSPEADRGPDRTR